MAQKAGIVGLAIILVASGACSVEATDTPEPLPLPYEGPFELVVVPELGQRKQPLQVPKSDSFALQKTSPNWASVL